MTDEERLIKEDNINKDYSECAASCGIELDGYFELKEDGDVEWISYWGR